MAQDRELASYLHVPTAGEVWVEPTPEMLWWTRWFGWLIAPPPGRETWLSRFVGVVTVTPSAHVANLSLHFQSYLFDLFHRTLLSRVAHVVCMPLINMMVLVWLAQFGADPGDALLDPSGALLAAIVLCVWYLVQGRWNGVLGLGLAMLPLTAATYVGAWMYWGAFGLSAVERTWWAPTTSWANPILWMVVLSFVQAASHAPEPKLPPRVTGTDHWQTLPEFVFGPRERRHGVAEVLLRLVRSALQIAYGALDEFWASWRLITVNVLELMWRLGYRPEMYAQWKALSRRAIEHGDPAIDFIGVGGGTRIRDPSEALAQTRDLGDEVAQHRPQQEARRHTPDRTGDVVVP